MVKNVGSKAELNLLFTPVNDHTNYYTDSVESIMGWKSVNVKTGGVTLSEEGRGNGVKDEGGQGDSVEYRANVPLVSFNPLHLRGFW